MKTRCQLSKKNVNTNIMQITESDVNLLVQTFDTNQLILKM